MCKIPFNKPLVTGREDKNIQTLLQGTKFCGDGSFTFECQHWLEEHHDTQKALLTTSCTHAIELAALLIDVQPGDEIIMPSYTFVSTANAFVLRGADIVFVDVNPGTMNIDVDEVARAVTEKTKAILPVHYAGVGCDMDALMDIASQNDIYVIEDAAQCILARYKDRPLGSIGHLGAISFHETKNVHCGEGGALFINDESLIEKAEIIREKGTNRKKFFRGKVDKYSWVSVGSSYLPSELNAAFLSAQLDIAQKVNDIRVRLWNKYAELFEPLAEKGFIELPEVPEHAEHNGHLFFIKVKDSDQRQKLINHLREQGIKSVFHYVPLHSSRAGKKYGVMENDTYTTKDSNRLLRLPMYYGLDEADISYIFESIRTFFD